MAVSWTDVESVNKKNEAMAEMCTVHGSIQGYLADKKPPPLGPYRRNMPRVLGGP